jgi:hypothetical protein
VQCSVVYGSVITSKNETVDRGGLHTELRHEAVPTFVNKSLSPAPSAVVPAGSLSCGSCGSACQCEAVAAAVAVRVSVKQLQQLWQCVSVWSRRWRE